MKIVFMGTPDFAVPCLEVCHELGEVIAVVTQPDRPKGRGKKLAPPPVKEKANQLGLRVLQPEKIKTSEATELIESLKPDLMIVVAYGQILSKRLLDIPKYGCINVHASLLPKLRGASPINWSIVTGESQTGVTTMYMSEGLDEGDMIDVMTTPITDEMTAGVLHDKLMELGAKTLRKTIQAVENGSANRIPQDSAQSTYAPILKKEMAEVKWDSSSKCISQFIRGFDPWPVAFTHYQGLTMKLYSPKIESYNGTASPGTILEVSKSGILIATADSALRVSEIQMPNGKRMSVSSYILGNDLEVGTVLG